MNGTRIKSVVGEKMKNTSAFEIEDGILKSYIGHGGDVVIPEGIRAIGKRAFWNCREVTSITIADSVKSIGYLFWLPQS